MSLDDKSKLSGSLISHYKQGDKRPSSAIKMEDDAVHLIKNGDILTVFNDVSKKDVLWQGEVSLIEDDMGILHQEDITVQKWHMMFWEEKPADIVPYKYIQQEKQKIEDEKNKAMRQEKSKVHRSGVRNFLKKRK